MSAPHWILTSYCLIFRHGPPSTATSTLSLHDALPISQSVLKKGSQAALFSLAALELLERATRSKPDPKREPLIDLLPRSEEHTSELQSRGHLVFRLLLEKNKTIFELHVVD